MTDKRLTKICRVMQKSGDFVGWQNRAILSAKQNMFYLQQLCRPTFGISVNKSLFMLPWWLFTTENEYLF